MAQQKKRPRKETRTVRDLIPDDVSVRALKATTREQAIAELLNVLVIDGVLDLSREQGVLDSILEREQVASTGIGNGVAIPHAKSKFAERLGLAVGTSQEGIEFAAHDDIPVFFVALWVCPPSATKEHLAIMRALASVAKDPNLSGRLAGCRDRRDLFSILDEITIEERDKGK